MRVGGAEFRASPWLAYPHPAPTSQQAGKSAQPSPPRGEGNLSSRRLRDLGDDLLRRIAQIIGGDDRAAAAGQDFLALLDVGAFEADDGRHRQIHFLPRGDDALGHGFAITYAAQNFEAQYL